MARAHSRGFSLIDHLLSMAVLGVATSLALPTYQESLARAEREDAIFRLLTLREAQETYRQRHGRYAHELKLLSMPDRGEGAFALSMVTVDANGYILRATARDPKGQDGGCQQLSLSVLGGKASAGPSAHCWNQ